MAADTKALIEQAVRRFLDDVPALRPLRLVFQLELRARGDAQIFRVELPGPKVTKTVPDDARVEVSMPRSHFNELAADGKVRHYREAYATGHIKVAGNQPVLRLIAQVIERQEERARLRKVH